jgi:hypothetical protein
MTRAEELAAQGWEKRAVTDEPRLSEMVAMYVEIGMEVLLEPFDPGEETSCRGCLAAYPGLYRTIYTRNREESS